MKRIFRMAIKDIRLISRDRLGLFFIVGFPVLMGVFFGSVMQINLGDGSRKMKVALIDQDQSEISQSFLRSLQKNQQLAIESDSFEQAQDSVRKGERVGMIVLPKGFGQYAGVFWNEPPRIELGLDPSRTAESAMLEGFIMQSIGDLVGQRFQNPSQMKPFIDDLRQQLTDDTQLSTLQKSLLGSFVGSIDAMLDSVDALQQQNEDDAETEFGNSLQFADIETIDVTRQIDPDSIAGQVKKLKSRWDISFPQGMMWGVLACVASFATSIARERTLGTLLRLQVAPISSSQILAGKALACFLTVVGVVVMLTAVGVVLGMRPASYPKLAAASFCIAACFVGIMMVISVIGKTEQSVNGAGWCINMVMAMFGGAMIPAMFLPDFMARLSNLSPVKWGIAAIEGAVWREFTWTEMLQPLGVLLAFGAAGLVVGVTIMRRKNF